MMQGHGRPGAGRAGGTDAARAAIGLLSKIAPEKAKALGKLRKTNPEAFRAAVGDLTKKVTDDYVPKALEYLKHFEPEKARRLHGLKGTRPDLVRGQVMQTVGKLAQFEKLRRDDPEHAELLMRRAQLTRKAGEIAKGHRAAGLEEKAEIKEHLGDVLNELFDTRTELMEREFRHLTERVDKLEDSIRSRQEQKGNLVTERLSQLTGKGQTYAW